MTKSQDRSHAPPAEPFSHRGVDVDFLSVEIPTYRMGPEDPNPPLFGQGTRAIYPYRRQVSFTAEIESRRYDAIRLRTSHIEATILPDWGMHLYRAIDRISGRDLFHLPKVMKPSYNAMRGAFVAGGVEMNFPAGHTVDTWSRVGVSLSRTDDGVQALFTSRDRRSGMRIAAGITMIAGCRALRFDQHLSNPTPLPRPWYYWLNSGIAPHESLRFLFPTRSMLGHFEGAFLETATPYAYPVHAGRDYSRYMDIPEPIGLFSTAGLDGWFGAYYDAWDFGILRWAPPWRVAGQKFWSWGNSGEGLLWGAIGGDERLPAPEIQSGMPETQMDRGIMRPYGRISHSEWWMPISAMPNIDAVSRYGALGIEAAGDRVRVRLSASESIAGARLELDGRILDQRLDLRVGQPLSIELPAAPARALAVLHEGNRLIAWSGEPTAISVTIEGLYDKPEPIGEQGPELLYLRGFLHERQGKVALAREWYAMALAKDPSSSRVHIRLGILALLDGRMQEAQEELSAALRVDRWNDEAFYLHGIAALWNGDAAQARADLTRAAATGDAYAVPAMIQLAMAALRDGDWLRAQQIVDSAEQAGTSSDTLDFLRAVLLRCRGNHEQWRKHLHEMDMRCGTSHYARWERMVAGEQPLDIAVPPGAEAADDAHIEAALAYAEIGARDVAQSFLTRLASPEGRTQGGYLARWLGGSAPTDNRHRFFAWGREMRLVLDAALALDPKDGVAAYALGCLDAERGDLPSARRWLEAACLSYPGDPLPLTTLGEVLLASGQAGPAAETLERALSMSPPHPRAWVLADAARSKLDRRDSRWLTAFAHAPDAVLRDGEARLALARLACDCGEYRRAIELLSGFVFHVPELSHGPRNLWSECCRRFAVELALAGAYAEAAISITQALDYPPNLQVGRPHRTFDAHNNYVAARICQLRGDEAGAERHLRAAAQEDQVDPTGEHPWSVLAMLALDQSDAALDRLGRVRDQAQLLIDARVQPTLDPELRRTILLCDHIKHGWRPEFRELADRR